MTPVGGQTRVSDGSADEGDPQSAGSNTELPARVQTRSHPPCPFLAKQERRQDSQGAWRLGQFSEQASQRGEALTPGERDPSKRLKAFLAREDGIR